MRPADLSPLHPDQQTERPVDLFLIFVGANIVATTLQVGASLPGAFDLRSALVVVAVGAVTGAGLVAALAPIGSRLRVPSIVAVRAALGLSGARVLAVLLFVTNFAWIALNDVIAASVAVRLTGRGSIAAWAAGLGVLATLVVLRGPHAVAVCNRLAVPCMLAAGVVLTGALLAAPPAAWPRESASVRDMVGGLDIVTGYQVSWLLLFADYPRFVRSPPAAAAAVFGGLAFTALWFMPLGLIASRLAQTADPGAMVFAAGVGWWGGVLLALGTLTTNFVNIYMSALAFKSLRPAVPDRAAVWLIGGVGAALGLLTTAWIEQFAAFMLVLAGAFVPVAGILLAHYVVLRRPVAVADLYDSRGPHARHHGWSIAGTAAWLLGAVVFRLAQPVGGFVPTLVVSMVVYILIARRTTACRRPPLAT